MLLSDCFLGPGDPVIWFDRDKAHAPVPAELRLRHVSAIAGQGPLIRLDATPIRVSVEDSVFAAPRNSEGVLVASDSPGTLEWRGGNNVYSRIGVYLSASGPNKEHDSVKSWSAAF